MADTRRWTVRPFQLGDERELARLFGEIFARSVTEEHYRWKVLGRAVSFDTAWLAVAGDHIVGQYACTPLCFKLSGHPVTAVHVCDVMTAANFRRQGVLSAAGSAANAAWAAAGVAFTTGLHYEKSWGSRREYLGWQRMFNFVWLERPLRFDRLVARRYHLPAPLQMNLRLGGWLWNAWWDAIVKTPDPRLTVREVTEAGPEFDELWQAIGSAYESLVVRDRAWVTYRFLRAPNLNYRILLAEREGRPAGYAAFRLSSERARSMGWVADLFTAPGDAAAVRALLRHTVSELRRAGADDARVLLSQDTWLEREFRRAGFLFARGTYDVSIVPLTRTLPLDSLYDPQRWFTMGGDFDVI